jgi:serine/threonine-protein kinase
LAYAHARGVLHRDLKPANVMVGAFGEVQVMDWGLAKVLGPAGAGPTAPDGGEGAVRTMRSGQPDAGSRAGALLGTPAYMAPEQARGEVDRLDERADVFGLGAILCETLTGQPPYAGREVHEVLGQARQGDLAGAMARLDGCGADGDLLRLARACLAAAPEGRPRDAGEVAGAVTAYLASVQERLRAAEVERAAAQAKAEEARAKAAAERRARRLVVGLAASVLALALLGGGGWWWLERKSAVIVRGVEDALQEAEFWQRQGKWPEALAAARRAEAMSAGGVRAGLRQRVRDLLADLEVVARLEEIPLLGFDDAANDEEMFRAYAAAFRAYGIDVEVLEPADAAKQIRRRAIREHLVVALDSWAFFLKDAGMKGRLIAILDEVDADDEHNPVRAVRAAKDRQTLEKLIGPVEVGSHPPSTLLRMALALYGRDEGEGSVRFLREARRQHPGNFWINHCLADFLAAGKPPQPGEAIRFYTAAVAIRPRSPGAHLVLGLALLKNGRLDGAIAAFKEAIRCNPDLALAHYSLGVALCDYRRDYDGAIAAFQEALRLRPGDAKTHYNLGVAFEGKGLPDEAIAAYRQAIALDPKEAQAYCNLGGALARKGSVDEAIAVWRKAVLLRGDFAEAHCNLGHALRQQGQFVEALAELRRGHELGSRVRGWRYPSARWVRDCERLLELDRRLPAVLSGQDRPAAGEWLEFAGLCSQYKRFAAGAAHCYGEAFAAKPELGEDLEHQHRYNAARAAALAGCGRGKDDPPPDEAARACWRKQALDWLRADLTLWAKRLDSGKPEARAAVQQALRHWRRDPDLAGLRDKDALSRLPEAEREVYLELWDAVDALLLRARSRK